MPDYYRKPPPVSETHEPGRFEYPKEFVDFHSLIEQLATKFCKNLGAQSGIIGLSLFALKEIEESMWELIKLGQKKKPEHFHIINAQLLSRPAIEITTRALLLLHNTDYVRAWEVSDWENMVQSRHINASIFENNAQRTSYADQAEAQNKGYTAALGLTDQDEKIVIKKFRNEATKEECALLKAKMGLKTKLPPVADICIGRPNKPAALEGSSYLYAAQVLYRYYKILCHPTHGSKNSLMQRASFRGVIDTGIASDELSEQEFQQDTIWIAMTLQLLLATITSHHPYTTEAVDDPCVAKALDNSWELLGTQSALGRELWEFWYKQRFGVIG